MTLLQSGFEFEIAMTIRGIGPVLINGTFPDAVYIRSPPLAADDAKKIRQALSLALNEATLSLTMREVPP